MLLRGYVAGGGEHAQHVSTCILVYRGVVKHVGNAASSVTDGEWVVCDGALRENLPVALARPLGLGEVVGEISSDQFFSRHTGHLGQGRIDIGDFPFGAYGDEWVERGLNQAAGILRRLLLGLHIARRREYT